MAAWIQAIAGILTFLSALAAAWIAAQVPRWSEQHRAKARAAEQTHDLQRSVLIALMKGRGAIVHQDTLDAINLIDVAFHQSEAVRAARRAFMECAGAEPFSPVPLVDCFYEILVAVVREMDLSGQITVEDIQQGYYPVGLGKLDGAAFADGEAKLRRRRQQ